MRTKFNSVTPTLQPEHHPLCHSHDMCHSTSIRMHEDREDEICKASSFIAILPQPHEFVFPHLLDNTCTHVAVAVCQMRQVLERHHIFIIPPTRDLHQG